MFRLENRRFQVVRVSVFLSANWMSVVDFSSRKPFEIEIIVRSVVHFRIFDLRKWKQRHFNNDKIHDSTKTKQEKRREENAKSDIETHTDDRRQPQNLNHSRHTEVNNVGQIRKFQAKKVQSVKRGRYTYVKRTPKNKGLKRPQPHFG